MVSRHDFRVLGLVAVFAILPLAQADPGLAEEQGAETLYERLGGVYAIAPVVDEFIERLLVNDTLNANPAIREARDRVSKAGLKYQVTSAVIQATGGPEVYSGRSMKEAHAHLNITEREWEAMVTELRATLYRFSVPDAEQEELVALVESMEPEIVARPEISAHPSYAEAAARYRREIEIQEKFLGPDHPRVATTLESYAALLREAGRGAEAAEMEARAKAIREKAEAPEPTVTAYRPAEPVELDRPEARDAQAVLRHRREIEILEKFLGPEHPLVAGALDKYAVLLREAGRSAEAAEMEARAKAIREKAEAPEPVVTATSIAAGLREALEVGTERVVSQVGRVDGFNADPEIHIPLPPTLSKVQSALRIVGMAGLADDLELRLNRAAEIASPKAKALFWQAIADMTMEDVKAIYDGPPDAATQYFRSKMSHSLAQSMQPVVDESLAEAGAIRAYDTMMGQYENIPFVPDIKADLTTYAVGKTIDGLFYYLAREETAIRQDPAKRTTELLQRVFGAEH